MYIFRLIAVLLLVLVILVAYSPQTRVLAAESWENIKPALIELMDGFYAAIRSLIAGNGPDNRFHETPAPGNPGVNFDQIITFHGASSF